MLDSEFKRNIDSARDVLVGKVPDPKAQIEQITTAMIYKFMDYMDRDNIELGAEPQFFIKEYERYSWSKLLDTKLSGEQRLDLYVQAITKLPVSPYLPELFRSIFKGTFLPFRDPYTLNLFLKEIDKFDYHNSENLGNAFEYLLSILGSQGDAGQFRTPRHIIDFIVSAVDPQKEDTILDPACGTSGFLISAYKHIIKHNSKNYKANDDSTIQVGVTATETILDSTERYIGEQLSPYEKSKLLANVTGYDISPDMVKLSLVNLYLHGFKKPQIFEYDTLSDDKRWDDDFDVILANPPFMSPKGGINPHKRFSIQANRSEVLFVDYIAEHLKIGGRAGIIVPEGIIFQASKAYKNLRKSLIDNWGLYAVVSLPRGVFQPYSGVKTSILFLDKNLAKQSQDILFIKVTNDGFDLGAQRRKIDNNDLPQALQIIKGWKQKQQLSDEKIALTVPKAKIAEDGDYNLTAVRYKEVIDYSNVKWEMVKLGDLEKQNKIEFLRGQGIAKKDLCQDGLYKCIHYGDIYTVYNTIIKEVINKTNFKGKILSKKGDVLIPATTTADAMGIAVARSLNEDNVVLGGDINIIRTLNKNIVSDYLALLISNPPLKMELATYAKGANILHISNKDIKNLQIPLPPLEIQQEIVVEIEQYQKVIDGAKLVVDSYKPEIEVDPEWEKVELGDVCEVQRGGSPRPINDFITDDIDGINWIKIGDVPENDKYVVKTKQKIKKEGISKTRLVSKGDFILSNSMSFGRPYILKINGAIHDGWLLIKIIDDKRISSDFLYYILSTSFVKNQYEKMATGGVVKNLNSKIVRNVTIPLPVFSVQQEIVARIEQYQSYVDGCKKLIEIYEQKIKNKIGKVWGE